MPVEDFAVPVMNYVAQAAEAMSFMDGELRRPTSSQELHGAGIGSRSVAIVATPGSSARFSRSERPGIVVPPFSRMPELSRQESTRACLVAACQ